MHGVQIFPGMHAEDTQPTARSQLKQLPCNLQLLLRGYGLHPTVPSLSEPVHPLPATHLYGLKHLAVPLLVEGLLAGLLGCLSILQHLLRL